MMAIYIGLELKSEEGTLRIYSISRSNGMLYGILEVDMTTEEIRLIESLDDRCKEFAFPRACRAIQKALLQGELPGKLCYAA